MEGLERYYTRLDVIAGDRSYTPSDKLHKLRGVLSKLDGDREKSIFFQIDMIIDTTSGDATATYKACFTFADKNEIDRPTSGGKTNSVSNGKTDGS